MRRGMGGYHFGDFRLDLAVRKLWRRDSECRLSPKAFDLLRALVEHVDEVVPKAALLAEVWPDVVVEESVLKVRIAEIRAALNETGAAPVYIHTHQRAGYRFAGAVAFLPAGTAGAPSPVVAFAERPALAILPFDNFTADAGEDYFADGIVEELTTRLARFRYFPVIARNSSFTYKGQAVDVPAVCRELGARYLVEGSVQRSEDRVRITVQLIDGQTGHHVWAERFESDFSDILSVSDEITELIAGATHSQVYAVEERRVARQSASDMGAWDCLLRAWSFQAALDAAGNESAKEQFLRALELDSQCAQAYSGLAMSHFRDVVHGWTVNSLESIRGAQRNAARSVECDSHDPYSHLATGVAHWLGGKREELLAAIEQSVWLNPSLAWAYLWGGIAYGVAGNADRSLEMAERAIRLSPLDPLRGLFDYALATAHFSASRYEEALAAAHAAARRMPDWGWVHCAIAASAGWLGRADEANAARLEAERLLPGLQFGDFARIVPFADPDFLERSLEGGRKAGWRG